MPMPEYRRISGRICIPAADSHLSSLPDGAAWVQSTPDYTLGARPIRSVYDAELRRLDDWKARYSRPSAGMA